MPARKSNFNKSRGKWLKLERPNLLGDFSKTAKEYANIVRAEILELNKDELVDFKRFGKIADVEIIKVKLPEDDECTPASLHIREGGGYSIILWTNPSSFINLKRVKRKIPKMVPQGREKDFVLGHEFGHLLFLKNFSWEQLKSCGKSYNSISHEPNEILENFCDEFALVLIG